MNKTISLSNLKHLQKLAKQIRDNYAEAQQLAQVARNKCNEAIAEALLCGQALNEAKQIVGHGNWLKWLQESCPKICERTARNYMTLANRQHVADLESATSLRRAYLAVGIIEDQPKPKPEQRRLTQESTEPAPTPEAQPEPESNHGRVRKSDRRAEREIAKAAERPIESAPIAEVTELVSPERATDPLQHLRHLVRLVLQDLDLVTPDRYPEAHYVLEPIFQWQRDEQAIAS